MTVKVVCPAVAVNSLTVKAFEDRIKSDELGLINTNVLLPLRFSKEPVELELKVRESCVPECVYTPVPISQSLLLLSSITYRTVSPSTTPAA